MPEMPKRGKPGKAHLPRNGRLCRKRSFPWQFYFDLPHQQALIDRKTIMNSFVSDSTVDSLSTETEASDTE